MSPSNRHAFRDCGLARGGVSIHKKGTKLMLQMQNDTTKLRKVKGNKTEKSLSYNLKEAGAIIDRDVFTYRPDLVKVVKLRHKKLSKLAIQPVSKDDTPMQEA
eukprot:GHVN01005436.1.p1 GENE.GHVN01005436.1~~GHVN01005436.1.p1  ORF type:complete len:103 (+),score=13.25 GHVN01005436.1:109-417(+)